MHAVILAAGEGSRMGRHSEGVPKAFMEIDGRTLYDRQRATLSGYADAITVVLGYRHETVIDEVGSARTVVVGDWEEYDNAESLRRALCGIDDDVLVLNGDVVVTESAVGRVIRSHARGGGYSVVACLPGVQTGHTALQCDEDGVVTDYGMIDGHRHAGLGVVDRTHVEDSERALARNREAWYPRMYLEIDTRLVAIPPEHHVELNRPGDKIDARRRLPFDAAPEHDART